MTKIAIFNTEFAFSGGAERMTFEQIDYLEKKGYKVTCFTAFLDRAECFPGRIKKYDIRQILPEFLNKIVPHDLMIMATTLTFPLFLFSFRNYNIFLGENHVAPWWAFMASLVSRKPYISYHNYPLSVTYPRQIDKTARRNTPIVDLLVRIVKPLIVFIDKLVVRRADLSFADGEYAKDVCEKAYGKEFINCPGGTEKGNFNQKIFKKRFSGSLKVGQRLIEAFKKTPNLQLGDESNAYMSSSFGGNPALQGGEDVIRKPYILITNRHFPAKRFDFGIKVLKRLATKGDSRVLLVITGAETSYTRKIKTMIKRLGLAKRVIFTGFVNEADLKKLYQNTLVYIYTAPEEDYGLGVLEAMAFGVPSVVWDKAGPSYLVLDGKTGYKITPGDISEFGNRVERLILNEGLNYRLARAAFEFSKNFSWENHGEILDMWLRRAIHVQPLPKYHSRYFHVKYFQHSLHELSKRTPRGYIARILDVGCGQGGLTLELRRLNPDALIEGCDIDKMYLGRFAATAKEQNISLRYADAHNLPYNSASYDAVFMTDVLEHLENPEKALREVCRVLKRRGVFHLIVPCEGDIRTIDGWVKKLTGKNLKEKPIGHIQQFTLHQIRGLISEAGFHITHVSYSYYLFYQLVSFGYYLVSALFNRGDYIPLKSKNKNVQANLQTLNKLAGWVMYLESLLCSRLQGQTAHITATKDSGLSPEFSKNFSWENHGEILDVWLKRAIKEQKQGDE